MVTIRDVRERKWVFFHYSLHCAEQRAAGALHPSHH